MTWLLIPAADRTRARHLVGRLDAIMGYPREHAEAEILRVGPASQRVPLASIRTDALCAVYRHDLTGAAQLHGAIAVLIDDAAREALRNRRITIDGVTRRVAEWIQALGWQVRATLPDLPTTIDEPNPWTRLAHRDGGEGSATGTPIPEGDE